MRIVRFILISVLIIGIILLLLAGAYRYYATPEYEGDVELNAIQEEAVVYFDNYGVPHIIAANEKDAMAALGYVHAQDRLWQMELLRRIAPGRLSELFGTKTVKADMFFAGIGLDMATQRAIDNIDKNSNEYKLALAYLNGINAFVDSGPEPLEYTLLGIKKSHFTIRDVYNIFGYMSFSFAMAQKTDPLLTWVRDNLAADYLHDLGMDNNLNTKRIEIGSAQKIDYSEISASVAALLEVSPAPAFIGSNSWILGPQKTATGKVLFANDPHIGFSQPCTWYEAHIVVPGHEIYGFYLAGTPFPLLGHNRQYAYGLTMFENDDLDFFREKPVHGNTGYYDTSNGRLPFKTRQHKILVKDSLPINLEIRESIHGPIVNKLLDGISAKDPVAMSWVYLQQPLHILKAVYGLSHAADITAFQQSVSLIAAPGLNVMYGDAKGNIAWFASGSLYKVGKATNTNFILDGYNGIDDRRQPLPFSTNPSSVNPAKGYVYSANNQPQAVNGYDYPGYYLPEDRAARITSLIDSKSNWTKADVADMMLDDTSPVAMQSAKEMLSVLKGASLSVTEKQALSILGKWKGGHQGHELAPVIYNKWIYRLLENTFIDELGADRFKSLLGTHLVKQIIAPLIRNPESVWWDIKTTAGPETRRDIILRSFHESVAALNSQLGPDAKAWTWSRVHKVQYTHPLGAVAALRPLFNVGPFESVGTNEVINNQFFPLTDIGIYEVSGGPSTRRIIDFSDIENSLSILPTGQSGNPFSKYYKDQAKMYLSGKYRKMLLNITEIRKSTQKLTFTPLPQKP